MSIYHLLYIIFIFYNNWYLCMVNFRKINSLCILLLSLYRSFNYHGPCSGSWSINVLFHLPLYLISRVRLLYSLSNIHLFIDAHCLSSFWPSNFVYRYGSSSLQNSHLFRYIRTRCNSQILFENLFL